MSIRHTPSNCFFFCFSMESGHFRPSVLHVALHKTLFLDFWFRPHNAHNLLPEICTKSHISRLVWQIDRKCLRLLGGFRGCPIQWNHAKCCGADPCCHGNEVWARRGDPVAYRLLYLYSSIRRTVHTAVAYPTCNNYSNLQRPHFLPGPETGWTCGQYWP